MNILLDNGHGKDTAGKRSPLWPNNIQIFEWEYTRKLVKKIHEDLKERGINSIILVPEDNDVSLSERCKRANKYDKNNTVLISVHLNAFDSSNLPSGWEIHHLPNSKKGKELASCFNSLVTFEKNRGIKESNFKILKDTNCPAVLTENLFMTNYNDCIYLNSEKGFNEIVKLHVNSIIKYINNND